MPEITPVPKLQLNPAGKFAASKAGLVTLVVIVKVKEDPTVAFAVVALVIALLTGVVTEFLKG